MTKDQLQRLAVKSRAYDKAARGLRRAMLDIFPIGTRVRINCRAGLYGRVTAHAPDAPMMHAESSYGKHRIYASDILASIAEGGEA